MLKENEGEMTQKVLIVAGLIALGCLMAISAEAKMKKELDNANFEVPVALIGKAALATPTNWAFFSSAEAPVYGLTNSKKKSGLQSIKIGALEAVNSFVGVAQSMDVLPGKAYLFSVYASNDSTNPIPSGAYGQISMEWKDASGTEIDRTFGPSWSSEISDRKWERFEMEGEAPALATV
ncbi:MAG: hypothetical protein V2A34_09975, partial [Lentisphaerota bacterium]